ncbi:MAG: ATP synthase F1 subunit epsilon [Candidatus Dadabacteria bacterium]|nr:MAG: ATP synthase F1 subunit epsilon [Candidatus Dadabacteria bacterium]
MSESFRLKIVTPAGVALDETVSELKLVSAAGEIGILPGHARYLGLLGTGVCEFRSAEDGQGKRLVLSGGFCNFSGGTLTVLADSVDFPESVDRESYGKDRGELQKIIENGDTQTPDFQYALERLKRIEAIDSLISN